MDREPKNRAERNNMEQNTMFPKREERVKLESGRRNRPRQTRPPQPQQPESLVERVQGFVLESISSIRRSIAQRTQQQGQPPQGQRPQSQRPQGQRRPVQQHEWIPDETFMERMERLWHERKGDLPLANRGIPKQVFGGVGVIILILILYFSFAFPNGTEVMIDGTRIGILEERNVSAEDIITIVEEQLVTSVGATVQINETITTEPIHISSKDQKDVSTEEYLFPKVRNLVTYQVDAASLYIDGKKEFSVATEEQLNSILEEIQSPYLSEGVDLEVSFVETVKVTKEFVDQEEIIATVDALALLQTVRMVTGEYVVQQGDALYNIAVNNNTTVEEILSLNPGMTIDTGIYVGEVLNIMIAEPKLSVKTIELQEYTTIEPKEYEYQYDSSIASGQKQVLQQGRAGQKVSVIQVTRINGFVVSEEEISKEIITEPITEIIVEGTG
ncbi:G5 domain-containing protein [Chakrabartyella piscis]|uniref:G5 domain-containing protein n=1 Tax=Chakrabartyella piscis TaxID=2918914 RepID=UPI0029585748|nr:G5 domain-containing protein [Chakrabartyella piscis]